MSLASQCSEYAASRKHPSQERFLKGYEYVKEKKQQLLLPVVLKLA